MLSDDDYFHRLADTPVFAHMKSCRSDDVIEYELGFPGAIVTFIYVDYHRHHHHNRHAIISIQPPRLSATYTPTIPLMILRQPGDKNIRRESRATDDNILLLSAPRRSTNVTTQSSKMIYIHETYIICFMFTRALTSTLFLFIHQKVKFSPESSAWYRF